MYHPFTKWALVITGTSALLCLLGVHDYVKTTLFGIVITTISMTSWPYVPQGGRLHGEHGPLHPFFGKVYAILARILYVIGFYMLGYRDWHSSYTTQKRQEMKKKLLKGETVYILGLNAGSHNTGASLVSVSVKDGINMLYNFEEERYSGDKHHAGFPSHSMDALFQALKMHKISRDQIHAVIQGWDFLTTGLGLVQVAAIENFPKGLVNFLPSRWKHMGFFNLGAIMDTVNFVNKEFDKAAVTDGAKGHSEKYQVISSRHHDNHAYFSFFASPFSTSKEPVMLCTIDAQGDDCSISLYTSDWQEEGSYNKLKMVYTNHTTTDSIGALYAIISSTQGGWTALSSEGRYMGASAFGNTDRMTNPFYKRLREIIHFGSNGQVFLNRAMANWCYDITVPYTELLIDVLGPPIEFDRLWNPDAILNVDNITHAKITTERVDKAAALQMVFEDCIFHIVGHMIDLTNGSTKLVWTGGTALNCLASMRLVDHFNESYYERYFSGEDEVGDKEKEMEKDSAKGRRLHVWVPPIPGDAGVGAGAAYRFAMSCDVPLQSPRLRHAFYCGISHTGEEIERAIVAMGDKARYRKIGNLNTKVAAKGKKEESMLYHVADLMAYLVSKDAIIGIYQGAAETGPRALGHRTILANPTNKFTSQVLNKHVKYREKVRPLAPMVTLEAAKEYFHLSPGAADEDYCAYDWMVLTTVVKEEARDKIPAVVHADNTSRLQIVRKETNELCHAYLKCMGRRVGVEVSVNTSLNVGTPIVQTPEQAVDVIKRSKGMHAIFLVGSEGDVYVLWDSQVAGELKDGGAKLNQWVGEWSKEVEIELASW